MEAWQSNRAMCAEQSVETMIKENFAGRVKAPQTIQSPLGLHHRQMNPSRWMRSDIMLRSRSAAGLFVSARSAMKNEKRKGKIHNSNAWCHMEWVEYRVRFERFAYIFRCWAFFLVIDGFTWDESKQFSKIYECLKYRLTWLLWSLRYF